MIDLDKFDPNTDTMAYYHALLDQVLCVLLKDDPEHGDMALKVFETSQGTFAMGFDSETRLADFAGTSAYFAQMSARAVVQTLRDMGLGLGVNFDVAPSSTLLPADVVAWLAGQADAAPTEETAQIDEITALNALPHWCDALKSAVEATDTAQEMWLATAHIGGAPCMGVFYAALPDQIAPSIAKLTYDVVRFAYQEGDADHIQVVFLPHGDPLWLKLISVGHRIPLERPQEPAAPTSAGPGLDPSKPPILR